jgi:hypothetical protein
MDKSVLTSCLLTGGSVEGSLQMHFFDLQTRIFFTQNVISLKNFPISFVSPFLALKVSIGNDGSRTANRASGTLGNTASCI